MKKLIPLLALFMMFACKKNTTSTSGGYSSFIFFDGQRVVTEGGMWVKYTYLSNKFNRAEFNFGYTDFTIGDSLHNFNQASGTLGTDSLIINTKYSATNGTFKFYFFTDATVVTALDSLALLTSISSVNMQPTITNISGNTISGKFIGAVKGINAKSGLEQTDSILNGIFTDIPIRRVYQ